MSFRRYALYYLPPPGPLADFGARWLGWDTLSGQDRAQFDLKGLASITATPRKYGFHGTIKPPFVLAPGTDAHQLRQAVASFAAQNPPCHCDGLALKSLGQFLALVPTGDQTALAQFAAKAVTSLDRFRAPADQGELARRRAAGLTPQQDEMLLRWGYPYVLSEFRFHLTLSGKLPAADLPQWHAHAKTHLPTLPMPFALNDIALAGAQPDGRFRLIERFALSG